MYISIFRGEVKVVMDPQQHKTQYPRLREQFAKEDRTLPTGSEQNGLADTPDSDEQYSRWLFIFNIYVSNQGT